MSDPDFSADADRTATFTDGSQDLLDRLAEEFTERRRRGENPTIDEFADRFPEFATRIRKFLPTVAMIEQLKVGPAGSRDAAPDRKIPEQLGEFRVVRELGRGGMGVVYEAVQESLGRHVALKVIHHVHLDAKRLQRFQRETQAVARLHHAHIVPIFGAGEHEGLPYYVMQYIPGSGLDTVLKTWRKDRSTPTQERWRFVAGVGAQAAEALQYAHEQGILHRDIKPANLLVDEHRAVWITDFGLAKLTGHDDLTATGDVIGTLRYLAPEALGGVTDARGDVYSLGLTLYEMLTLAPPFGELTPSQLLRHVSEGQPTRPRRLDPSIPRDLETIVLKATAREPGHRYPTAGALADDLKRFLDDRPIHARRVTPFERLWRWGRRNRATAAMSVTAAVAILVASVVGWAGYAITTQALESESNRRAEAERATRRAEQNVALSLAVFEALFDRLTPHESLVDPPPGRFGRPMRFQNGPGGRRGGPGAPGGDPFDDGPPPPPPRHGDGPRMDGGPPGGPGGDPFGPDGGDGPGGFSGGRPGRRESVNETELLRSVLTFYDTFARQNVANPKLQGEAAAAYRRVGALYERLGQDAEAEKANSRAVEILEELVAARPRDPGYRAKLVETDLMVDPWSADPASLPKLEAQLGRARTLVDGLVAEAPDNLDYALWQIHAHAKLGAVWQLLGRADDAEACYRRSIDFCGSLIARAPRPLRAGLDRAMIRENLADLQLGRSRRAEAIALLDKAAADLVALREGGERSPMLSEHIGNLARLFEQVGETDRAREMSRNADDFRTSPDGPGRHRGPGPGPPPD